MPNIFICYRRDDSLPWTGRLHEHFARHFGAEHVFVDIDSIAPGEDFLDVVRHRVEECDVFVPVIGRTWMTIANAAGNRRLDDQDDYVRTEIAAALNLRKRIVPVVVGGARMPEKRELPGEIAALATRNAFAVDDLRFADDARRLIKLLERAAAPGEAKRPTSDAAADAVLASTVARPEAGGGAANRGSAKRTTISAGRSGATKRVAWIVAGVAAAAMVLLVAGRLLRSEYAPLPPQPVPGVADIGVPAFFDPHNSPSDDVDLMKLKRVIDDNQQHADLERAGASLRSGIEKPNLGVLLERVSATFAQALGMRAPNGAMISEVARGGLAELAGLRRGDVIVRVNSEIVGDVGDFDRKLAGAASAETVTLDVWRILGPAVDTFTIKVALPAGSHAEPILRSIEKRALQQQTAGEIMRQYNETARAAIDKINR